MFDIQKESYPEYIYKINASQIKPNVVYKTAYNYLKVILRVAITGIM